MSEKAPLSKSTDLTSNPQENALYYGNNQSPTSVSEIDRYFTEK